jgi:hypothetical protein
MCAASMPPTMMTSSGGIKSCAAAGVARARALAAAMMAGFKE